MRLAAFVSPKSRPKIHATRSNSAIATRPQLSPPTISKVAASRSIRSILSLLCRGFVQTLARPVRLCQIFVQILYSGGHGRRWTFANWRAEQAHGHERRLVARLGAALRPAEP